ncbi:MAG: energy-coupled thiamine transporter ThiT [Oscillospiraceae bacterium]|nr:energy-coupled thiamine transporter ThiT [Oscillospiraceae bacterium]
MSKSIRPLAFAAICVTLSLVLSQIRLFTMPQGGSVSAMSMLFIVLAGYWFGPKIGITAGLAYGFLRIFLGAFIIHPAQFALDYLLPSAALGAFGFFRYHKWGLYFAYIMGAACAFLGSFASGIIFFSSFAPEGQHVAIYSAVYNLSFILPEVVITLALISLPQVKNAIDHVSPI